MLGSSLDSSYRLATNHCAHHDHDGVDDDFVKDVSILIIFLTPDPSSKTAITLLRQVNRCYDCFEGFVRNFSDYLSVISDLENKVTGRSTQDEYFS